MNGGEVAAHTHVPVYILFHIHLQGGDDDSDCYTFPIHLRNK
jgi:hypothetical protein